MNKKKQPNADRELIRTEMRKIISSEEAHERDRVAAGKLLRQTHIDESEEESDQAADPLETDEFDLMRRSGLLPARCDETEA